MELLQAIASRRAVREYAETPVERETLEALIATAVLAPSARNLQPWAFAVQRSRARIADYAQRAKDWLLANEESAGLGSLAEMLQRPGFSIFYEAPALVLVMATGPAQQAAEDCCLAAQTLLLAARDRNLGTCWVGLGRGWLNLPETKRELGIPAQYQVVAPIVVGHPRAWPPPHGRTPPAVLWLDA